MRVLLAHDGSSGADKAVALLNAIDLPTGSAVRVIHVVDAVSPPDQPSTLDALQARLRPLELVVREGRPGDVVASEAVAFGADLVVLGPSREIHDPTGAWDRPVWVHVIDNARAPVLVVRKRSLRRLVLGVDGSPAARAATDAMANWALFRHVEMRAVSVATVKSSWHTRALRGTYPQAITDYRRDLLANEQLHAEIARASVARLRAAGRFADWWVVAGDPAMSLLRFATSWEADVVAIGAGQTQSSVTSIGGVERQVLAGSRSSVLLFPPMLRPRGPSADAHVTVMGTHA